MKLFHGSNILIENPDISKCHPYKDFGKGFYLTDLEHQAQRMAKRVAKMRDGQPIVSVFDFDIESAKNNGLKIKIFEKPNDEWAEFVLKNRDVNVPQPCHDYDIVIGPVANDTIVRLLRLFTENFIDKEQLLRELTFSEVTSQYFFHNEKALTFLRKL